MRSSGVHDRQQVDWQAGENNGVGADVGLTLKLQQKLKEAQKDNERLEKKLEEMEAVTGKAGERKTGDTLRMQELELENGKLQADLRNLRQSLAEDSGDGSQLKEMIGMTRCLLNLSGKDFYQFLFLFENDLFLKGLITGFDVQTQPFISQTNSSTFKTSLIGAVKNAFSCAQSCPIYTWKSNHSHSFLGRANFQRQKNYSQPTRPRRT